MVEAAAKATPTDRTVAAQVEHGRACSGRACQSGQMSEGRYDAYCRNIGTFMDWIGPRLGDRRDRRGEAGRVLQPPVHAGRREGRYSPTSAHELLMTAKQFISRLAEMKLIPLPGNIRSRRFRFNHSVAAEIETFTVEEVRALLAACDGYPSGRSSTCCSCSTAACTRTTSPSLRQDEVDWKAGPSRGPGARRGSATARSSPTSSGRRPSPC